ncbi:hypothetical protein [Casimicrobium huifangae]|uniref:hypothetical protein n=1 Tax=Casimicrobium huifangae TaxID=2591109 RepID=UPI0037844C51
MAWLSANAAAAAEPTETLRNHYNDPFVRVTNAIAACPLPRGPFMTEREAWQAEAHPRIERGTTCFMAGKCKEPNAYRYDARIAERAQAAVVDAVRETPALAKSSVWLTVQRRFVFAQVASMTGADCANVFIAAGGPGRGVCERGLRGGLYGETVSAGALPGDADGQCAVAVNGASPGSGVGLVRETELWFNFVTSVSHAWAGQSSINRR